MLRGYKMKAVDGLNIKNIMKKIIHTFLNK